VAADHFFIIRHIVFAGGIEAAFGFYDAPKCTVELHFPIAYFRVGHVYAEVFHARRIVEVRARCWAFSLWRHE
jgi:hypothetical protein